MHQILPKLSHGGPKYHSNSLEYTKDASVMNKGSHKLHLQLCYQTLNLFFGDDYTIISSDGSRNYVHIHQYSVGVDDFLLCL